MENNITIDWFGRCCFLVSWKSKKILFDPYDTFCNVDIGQIDSDILLSSSTWHDHGHIGASPNSFIYTYSGIYNNSGVLINGIESKERRGTPNIIFNIKIGDFSITNFADLGQKQKFSNDEIEILRSTDVALVRSHDHYDIAMKYCKPNRIIFEHYLPKSFIDENVPISEQTKFESQYLAVDTLIEKLNIPVVDIDTHKVDMNFTELNGAKIIKFAKINPQVKYKL